MYNTFFAGPGAKRKDGESLLLMDGRIKTLLRYFLWHLEQKAERMEKAFLRRFITHKRTKKNVFLNLQNH